MKKFKNKFVVTGPISLLTAFLTELANMGYEFHDHWKSGDGWSYITHGFHLNAPMGSVILARNEGGYEPGGEGYFFTLPQDWDRAIKCAEGVQEQPKLFFAGMEVHFEDGHIKIGCQRIDNEFVLSLNKLLGDEFKIVQRTPDGDEDVMDEFSNIVSHIKRAKP